MPFEQGSGPHLAKALLDAPSSRMPGSRLPRWYACPIPPLCRTYVTIVTSSTAHPYSVMLRAGSQPARSHGKLATQQLVVAQRPGRHRHGGHIAPCQSCVCVTCTGRYVGSQQRCNSLCCSSAKELGRTNDNVAVQPRHGGAAEGVPA